MIKLNAENYFSLEANMDYMSTSQFKAFQKCESCALAEIKEEYQREMTTSLLVGSYVDAHFEKTLDLFKAKHPEIFTKQGDLKADYRKAEEIISRIERDKLFMDYMSGEKQVIMTGEIEGVPFKVKIDSYLPDKIVDLKIMKDFEPVWVEERGKLNFIEGWGYDLQGAIYQEIVYQNTGKRLPFYIAAATKEKVSNIDIFQIPQKYLDLALDVVKENVMRYDSIKKGIVPPSKCGKCDYCKLTKVLEEPRNMEELDYE